MQTAVQWLVSELQLYYEGQSKLVYYEIIEQAKEMEKEQIIDAYMARMDITDKEYFKQIIGGQYYNETFKKD